jgi:hypothetical protein
MESKDSRDYRPDRSDSKSDGDSVGGGDFDRSAPDAKATESGASKPASAQTKQPMDGDFLITELQKYFYEDDELCATFENFVDEKSSIIDLASEEYSLEYTRVYHEYRDLLENKLEAHIERLGYDPVEFYQCVRDKVDNQPDGSIAFFAQLLLAVSEFDIFMTMMKEAARKRQTNRK